MKVRAETCPHAWSSAGSCQQPRHRARALCATSSPTVRYSDWALARVFLRSRRRARLAAPSPPPSLCALLAGEGELSSPEAAVIVASAHLAGSSSLNPIELVLR